MAQVYKATIYMYVMVHIILVSAVTKSGKCINNLKILKKKSNRHAEKQIEKDH